VCQFISSFIFLVKSLSIPLPFVTPTSPIKSSVRPLHALKPLSSYLSPISSAATKPPQLPSYTTSATFTIPVPTQSTEQRQRSPSILSCMTHNSMTTESSEFSCQQAPPKHPVNSDAFQLNCTVSLPVSFFFPEYPDN
jgi:hypothetical protein